MPLVEHPKSQIPEKLQGLHLFHFDGAPCAQRVRFALGEKGLARGREEKFDAVSATAAEGEQDHWVSRMVSLVKKDHLTQAYAEIHPNMVVPALVHDGRLHLESLDIIEYLDEAFGGAPLVPTEQDLKTKAMSRVEQAKDLHKSIRYVTFHWGLGRLAMLNPKEREQLAKLAQQGNDGESLVNFYDGYSKGSIPDSVYRDHLVKLHDAFGEVNEELKDGRQFLTSDEISIADAFWSMKILRLIECGYPVEKHHPELYAWYQRVYARPSFQNEVMGKNRLTNRAFRIKAGFETLLGIGLKKAVDSIKS
ncbi:MAG: glutathione S-transferase family protein [Pseudomonadales bacterium]